MQGGWLKTSDRQAPEADVEPDDQRLKPETDDAGLMTKDRCRKTDDRSLTTDN
jgi:hypothetical protein